MANPSIAQQVHLIPRYLESQGLFIVLSLNPSEERKNDTDKNRKKKSTRKSKIFFYKYFLRLSKGLVDFGDGCPFMKFNDYSVNNKRNKAINWAITKLIVELSIAVVC